MKPATPMLKIGLAALMLASLTACGGSRLFTNDGAVHTPGSVPRDEMGEPIWDRIKPPPSQSQGQQGGASDGT